MNVALRRVPLAHTFPARLIDGQDFRRRKGAIEQLGLIDEAVPESKVIGGITRITANIQVVARNGNRVVCSWSDFIRRDGVGNIIFDSRTGGAPEVGTALWSEPYPVHSVENVGSSELRVIAVEIKSTRH
jgi:hypothetical protein